MKRILSLVLAAALFVGQPLFPIAAGLSGSRTPAPRRVPALAHLAGVLRISLPEAVQFASLRSPTAASFSVKKAAVLWQRVNGQTSLEKLDQHSLVSADKLLMSINSVLIDFTPDDLKKMPA